MYNNINININNSKSINAVLILNHNTINLDLILHED